MKIKLELYGASREFSDKDYFLSNQGMSFDVMGLLSQGISSSLSSHFGKVKKCLV